MNDINLLLLAWDAMQVPGVGQRAVAKFTSLSKTKIQRLAHGEKIRPTGRPRKVPLSIQRLALNQHSKNCLRGNGIPKKILQKDMEIRFGSGNAGTGALDKNYFSRLQDQVPKLKSAAPRVRSRGKMSATNAATVKAMFTSFQEIAKQYGWSLAGCEKGTTNIPAGAVVYSDEIQLCQDRGDKIKIVCQGKEIPLAISSGIDAFKLTVLVSVGLDGVLHPAVCVYSGKTWQIDADGRLRGINSDWGFDYTDTGDGEQFTPGTMAKITTHWVEKGRK